MSFPLVTVQLIIAVILNRTAHGKYIRKRAIFEKSRQVFSTEILDRKFLGIAELEIFYATVFPI